MLTTRGRLISLFCSALEAFVTDQPKSCILVNLGRVPTV
jgi:hypothetical protein